MQRAAAQECGREDRAAHIGEGRLVVPADHGAGRLCLALAGVVGALRSSLLASSCVAEHIAQSERALRKARGRRKRDREDVDALV